MLTRRGFATGLLTGAAAATLPADLSDLTATDAADLLRRKRITPAELTQACLSRIAAFDPELKAFITVLGEQAMAQARALSPKQAASQPLHGIPVALKDLYDTAGIRTTAGSEQWRNRVPDKDATVTARLHNAGSVLVGKANMDEFAYNFTAETSAFGVAKNPWDRMRSPGGSSGGSAVAVAAGLCLGALGSDTGGSIRLPAAFCGITGYKPTYGVVPADGVAPLAWSLDHPGPMTRTARDAALFHSVLANRPLQMPRAKDLRLGVAREAYWRDLESDIESPLEQALDSLRRIAKGVRDVPLPGLPVTAEGLPRPYVTVIISEAFAFHREMLKSNPGGYHPGTRASIESGQSVTTADYIDARRQMEQLRATVAAELFRDIDILVTPAAPGAAFLLGSRPTLKYLSKTAPWNLYGLPTLVVPCGFTKNGLPTGLQLCGAPGQDDAVLAVGVAFQSVTDFHTKRPLMGF